MVCESCRTRWRHAVCAVNAAEIEVRDEHCNRVAQIVQLLAVSNGATGEPARECPHGKVREYDSREQGLEYLLKCLNAGANLYEVKKFSYSADEVMLANSIWNPANLNRVSDTLVTG